jgi:[acyl-carrier-protein] S-malonyltransferase
VARASLAWAVRHAPELGRQGEMKAVRGAGEPDMTAAWLFPGQGSQYVGMAMGWAGRVPEARGALDEASEVLGFDLPRLLANGPAEVLADTYNQQAAVLAASVAILRAVGDAVAPPAFVAGHSLGEYTALVAAGSLAYPDALRLVRERGRLMREAGELNPGSMAAILGLDDDVVLAVCDGIDGVQVANFNAPGQVVISGTHVAVAEASERLRQGGAARVVPLPITIAAHSELMRPVADRFAQAVAGAPLAAAVVPVVGNVTATPIRAETDLRAELTRQLTAAVRWSETIRVMLASGVQEFYEIGPGTVLTGLVKRVVKAGGAHASVIRSLGEPES